MDETKRTITCPSCNTVFALPADMLGTARRALKCAICKDTFVIEPVSAAAEPGTETSEETGSFEYNPETSPWDTDPHDDPVLQNADSSEDPSEDDDDGIQVSEQDKELQNAWVDYDSVSLDELTFGEDGEDSNHADLEFGESEEEETSVEDLLDSADDAGPVPEPQPPTREKINPLDDTITLDGRRAEEVEKTYAGSSNSLMQPDGIPGELEEDELVATDDFEDEYEDGDGEEVSKGSPLDALIQAEKAASPRRSAERKPGKRNFLRSSQPEPEELAPSSGMIYYLLMILIGAGAVISSFIPLGELSFDPVWGASMIALGLLGFILQNLSAIYIGGFFSVLYSFALFGRISSQISAGNFTGITHVAVVFGLAFVFSLTYALLIGRRSGHFVLKESSFHSIASIILGLLAVIYGYWSLIDSQLIAPLGQWELLGNPINSFSWYGGVELQVIAQAIAAAAAVAFGISAHRLRNRQLILAKVGILLGITIIGLLFATVYLKTLTFTFPV